MRTWAVVPVAGAGRRMGGPTPKQFLALRGKPLVVRAVGAVASWSGLSGIVVVSAPDEVARTVDVLGGGEVPRVLRVVPGGAERQDSVRLGLEALVEADDDDVVFVHDGVRPFPPVERFAALREAAHPHGALLALPCQDTLKREDGGVCVGTLDRGHLWQAQTPQAFPVRLLREAIEHAEQVGFRGTDEASLVEALGLRPRLLRGDPRNLKITTSEDLSLAKDLLPAEEDRRWGLHVGHGYDVHRMVEGRRLVLGGVDIPHEKGLLGHSDADVLAHAVADACLGAGGLGDIGRHFPDTDPAWKDASSLDLLARVALLLEGKGLRPLRVDATLVAQRPRVAEHIGAMELNLGGALGLPLGRVTVKATTTEGLGFEGRMEGISAHAVALVSAL